MAQSSKPGRSCLRSIAFVCILCAVSRFTAVGAYDAPLGSGHFRFASIHWTMQQGTAEGTYDVEFTIRSSWVATYGGFHNFNPNLIPKMFDESKEQSLLGTKPPAFTIFGSPANVTHALLKMNVTRQNWYRYSLGGDWVEGETKIRHTFSSKGPHRAVFSGCCRVHMVGGLGDFEQEVSVDLASSDFSPSVPALAGAYLNPGIGVSLPALHPRGTLDPKVEAQGGIASVARYTFAVLETVNLLTNDVMLEALPAGVSLHNTTGVLAVSQHGTAHGMFQVKVRVSIDGTHSSSSVIQLLNISHAAPQLPARGAVDPAATAITGTHDMRLEFRTGFAVRLHIPFTPSHNQTNLTLHSVSYIKPANMEVSLEQDTSGGRWELAIEWNKPCWLQSESREVVVCSVVSEVPAQVQPPAATFMLMTLPSCLYIRILEDEAPQFTSPAPKQVFEWEMGRASSFVISVVDAAAADTVSKLELAENTRLPAAMVLTPVEMNGNTARREITWEPLPTAGGGVHELCFVTADTPGSSYEKCRLGTREMSLCVEVKVASCRYKVRVRESLVDVATRFNTDWMQLWALNPQLHQPDIEVGFQQDSSALGGMVKTGHMYKVDRGDYLSAIAYKFGTSVKMLLHLNANLVTDDSLHAGDQELKPGMKICVIPNSCFRD